MKFATIRTPDGNRAVRKDGDVLVDLGYSDLGELLANTTLAAATPTGPTWSLEGADFAPTVPSPAKVVCVGHNYRNHILEMKRELPTYPTLFTKFASTLIGPYDDIVKPGETDALDWEVELTVVIGDRVRRATEAQAAAAIAGFTIMNDISMRDWQFRTIEWTQGKIWDSSTPVGPWLVTPDELPGGVRPALAVRTTVDEQVMQNDDTGTLLFDPVYLVQYVSTLVELRPGDLIATGTPAGVGHAREPKIYLMGGETVTTEIENIGRCINRIVKE